MGHQDEESSSKAPRYRPPQTPMRNPATATPSRLMTTRPRANQQPNSTRRTPLAFEDEQSEEQSFPLSAYSGSALGSSSISDSDSLAGMVRPSSVQTPTKFRTPISARSATTKARHATPPTERRSNVSSFRPLASTKKNDSRLSKKLRRIRYRNTQLLRSKSSDTTEKKREFQIESNFPRVFVKTFDLDQRSAFGPRPFVSLEEWKRIASKQSDSNANARMSPSYQHLRVLHALFESRRTIRQLQFSPSLGQDADLFVDWLEVDDYYDKRNPTLHDGRYRSINPVQATRSILPSSHVVPVLSYRKTRLPMRSDVGFPNATEDEIRQKQQEIKYETEWEETSPRLALLLTSDDLGSTVLDDEGGKAEVISQQHFDWNGGGLPGMPFAGRELLQAKERNAKYFRRKSLSHLKKFMGANPYSMLAPPLEASFSPSQGWRPRPYNDRPPGMKYLLVCPGDFHIKVGDMEPLVCSLALYCFPRSGKTEKGHSHGKISEEFWFPAGDWGNDKVVFQGAVREDGSVDEDILEAWMHRQRKAVYSYDPSVFSDATLSCFLVLQIYNLLRPDVLTPFMQSQSERTNQSGDIGAGRSDRRISDRMFEKHGVQHLSPLCFGMTPLLGGRSDADAKPTWPKGKAHKVQLYCSSSRSQSEETFLRLSTLMCASQSNSESLDFDLTHIPCEETCKPAQLPKDASSRVEYFPFVKKRASGRSASLSMDQYCGALDTFEVIGSCFLVVSSLPNDFLQCMLSRPSEIDHTTDGNECCDSLPRLFVDVSGDNAILLDSKQEPRGSDLAAVAATGKRSNLIRLPSPREPSGYSSAAEFQELLYLPPRAAKRYDTDRLYFQSNLNLLFLYPRLLTCVCGFDTSASHLTLRFQIRRIQSRSTDGPGVVSSTARLFYNPAQWTGQTLIPEIFTRAQPFERSGIALRSGIFFGDEFKIRLPEVLDGSYVLEISLFEIDMKQNDVILRKLADVSIPLSTSSALDQERVATVLPNGNHRIKLGTFLLQLESRLISAYHIGEPETALVLRELPFESFQPQEPDLPKCNPDPYTETNRTGRSLSLLTKASHSNLVAHIDPLLYILKSILVQDQHKIGAERNISMNLSALFLLLGKVKSRFACASGEQNLSFFIKSLIDVLDDSEASNSSGDHVDASSSRVEQIVPTNRSHSDDEDSENIYLSGDQPNQKATRIKQRSRRLSFRHEVRMSRLVEGLGAAGLTFSRVSFASANKFDQMLLHADSGRDENDFAVYFEDDETVISSPTLPSIRYSRSAGDGKEFRITTIRSPRSGVSDIGILRAGNADLEGHIHLNGGQEFAQRVRTAAQVMLAPCGMGPLNFTPQPSNGLANPPGKSQTGPELATRPQTDKDANDDFQPGSDIEDDESLCVNLSKSGSTSSQDKKVDKTGSEHVLTWADSIDPLNAPFTCGRRIYETLMIHWLRAWADNSGSSDQSQLRPLPIWKASDSTTTAASQPLHDFFTHADFILPICLKSLSLRCVNVTQSTAPIVFDEMHLQVFTRLVDILCVGAIIEPHQTNRTASSLSSFVLCSLSQGQTMIDFLVGLLALVHPEQMDTMLKQFYNTLRGCESDGATASDPFFWSEDRLQRVMRARYLRLRSIESFAVLPCFMAINFPPIFLPYEERNRASSASWAHQIERNERVAGGRKTNKEPSRLPRSGWLVSLLVEEALSVCALSSETLIAEAWTMAHETGNSSVSRERPGVTLSRDDLLKFQSNAVHAVTCVYELVVRRHAMDKRYQSQSSLERVAGVIAIPILDRSISSVRWLARMDAFHKVRTLWLTLVLYALQESPESCISSFARGLCNPNNFTIHRFIRLLRLCSATLQSLFQSPLHANLFAELDGQDMSPWLVQESYNTICATINTLVDECAGLTSSLRHEQERITAGILDLLLNILMMPQTPVTHLRALGSALQVLERFGILLFLEATGQDMQNWLRVIIRLMSSTSLSVRSIAVDFFVSLLGSLFQEIGCVDDLMIVFATLLPEVAAREIALYSVAGLLSTLGDVAKCLWPLRRSIADLEEADDRIGFNLATYVSIFCRACQAIIDGVLVEIRLRGDYATIVGTKVCLSAEVAFDADEESLLEAASFFSAEAAPLQKVRWLLTLAQLHKKKHQWLEAAESLFLCTRTLLAAIPYNTNIWRPSRYDQLFIDSKQPWLVQVGKDKAHPERGYKQVMEFAQEFLEPSKLLGSVDIATTKGMLPKLSLRAMSDLMLEVFRDAISCYKRQPGMGELAYLRLDHLLVSLVDMMKSMKLKAGDVSAYSSSARKRRMEEETVMRRTIYSISSEITKFAKNDFRFEAGAGDEIIGNHSIGPEDANDRRLSDQGTISAYVVVRISGRKPPRFDESSSLPTFLEFSVPCICRLVDHDQLHQATRDPSPEVALKRYAHHFLRALHEECPNESVVLKTEPWDENEADATKIYLHIFFVETVEQEVSRGAAPFNTRTFFYRKPQLLDSGRTAVVEMKVAQPFPGVLSRQRVLVTTEIYSGSTQKNS